MAGHQSKVYPVSRSHSNGKGSSSPLTPIKTRGVETGLWGQKNDHSHFLVVMTSRQVNTKATGGSIVPHADPPIHPFSELLNLNKAADVLEPNPAVTGLQTCHSCQFEA